MVHRAAWGTTCRVLRGEYSRRRAAIPGRRAVEAMAKGIRTGRTTEVTRAGLTAAIPAGRMEAPTEARTVAVAVIRRRRAATAVPVVVITAAPVVVITAAQAAVTTVVPAVLVATAQVLMEEDIAKPG